MKALEPGAASSDWPDEVLEAARICNIAAGALFATQWRYLLVWQEFLARGVVPSMQQCCAEAKLHRTTVWRWFQTPKFYRAVDRVTRNHVNLRDTFVDFAVQTAAMRGNMRAAEVNLRRRGKWDGPIVDVPIGGGAPGTAAGAQAVAQVVFVGLPQPPSAEQRAVSQPPLGSSMIYTAAGVLEETRPVVQGGK